MAQAGIKIDRTSKTLRELAHESMRKAIFSAHFPPGSRLVERKLCDELGVSRTVVREVLRQLETEGLVETIPHIGPIVASLDWQRAEQIYEVRGVLEAMAIRACAQVAQPSDVDKLNQLVEKITDAFSANHDEDILPAVAEFYEAFFTIGNKPFAWEVVQSLHDRISLLRAMTTRSPNRQKASLKEIEAIVQAVSDNDPDQAELASWAHVNMAASIAKQMLLDKEAEEQSE